MIMALQNDCLKKLVLNKIVHLGVILWRIAVIFKNCKSAVKIETVKELPEVEHTAAL